MNEKMGYVLFGIMIILQAIAQMLEKHGMTQVAVNGINFNSGTLFRMVTNPYIIIGLLLTATGFVLWLFVLSQFKISYITAFGSVLYILTAILGYYILGEGISVTRIIGIGVIVTGCILINL
jgi:drug/metabolite transporter (DMT)-like permease